MFWLNKQLNDSIIPQKDKLLIEILKEEIAITQLPIVLRAEKPIKH